MPRKATGPSLPSRPTGAAVLAASEQWLLLLPSVAAMIVAGDATTPRGDVLFPRRGNPGPETGIPLDRNGQGDRSVVRHSRSGEGDPAAAGGPASLKSLPVSSGAGFVS